MNGIRLAVLMTAAFAILSAATTEALGQDLEERRRQAEEALNRARGGDRGVPNLAERAAPGARGSASKNAPSAGSSSRNEVQSQSRNRSRSRNSSSRSQPNAIRSNPLFKLFDTDGDGELSLEEIDAASRLLYSLDTNQDDSITADEVEDMAMGKMKEDDDDDDGSRTARSSGSRSSRGSSSKGGKRSAGITGMTMPDSPELEGRKSGRSGSGSATRGSRSLDRGGRSLDRGSSRGGFGLRSESASRSGASGADQIEDFASYDRDEDGVLKRGELPSNLRSKFRRIDTNKDGKVDEDEFEDYLDSQ